MTLTAFPGQTVNNQTKTVTVTHLIEMSHMSEISEYEYYTWF